MGKAEQVANRRQRKAQGSGAANEGQDFRVLAPIEQVATRATSGFFDQPHTLVGADRLDIDAGLGGKTCDRDRGKCWHGAGVAFEDGVVSPATREGSTSMVIDHRTRRKEELRSATLLVLHELR